MATPIETPKKPGSSILQRLPRLGTRIWVLIILCLFLIAVVPLAMGYMTQSARQQALKLQIGQLQPQVDALKAKMASQPAAAAEMGRLKAEAEAAKLLYKSLADNPEISQVIMDLAWDNHINITSMSVSSSKSKILDKEYPVLVYSLSLTGQVAGFQNFLIAIGNKLPSSQYSGISIRPAAIEGEPDTASIGIQVYCSN